MSEIAPISSPKSVLTATFILISPRARRGFTLIELSIVLVIIALIIGGVLVGQNMIKAAQTRSAISQLEKYNSAATVFRSKYGGLPGDLPASKASQFLFATRSGNIGHGDGDGFIKGGNVASFTQGDDASCGEVNLFWNDLSTASLISGQYTGTDTGNAASDCNIANPATLMPPMTVNDFQMLVTVYGDQTTGKNYFYLLCNPTVIDSVGGWACAVVLSPLTAYMIDTKIDDGLPQTGFVQAVVPTVLWNSDPPYPVTPAAPATGVCVSNATGNPYNIIAATGGNSSACSIRLPFD